MTDGTGYILPDSLVPERLCFRVSVPNDQQSIAAFLGQISELGYWYNWQRDPTHFAKLVSSVWAGEYELATERYNSGEFFAGDCSVSFCDEVALCPPSIRNDPLGGLQWLNPTTGHWEPLPGSGQDPRTDGTVPPPWMSPPLGQTGNCLAAANITEFFKAHNDNVIAQLGISAGLFAVVPAIMALLDLIFLPIGLIATVAVELAASYIAYSAATLSAAFTSTNYDKIRCALECHIEADGKLTTAELSDITTDINAIDPVVASVWNAYAALYGVNGLMKQEQIAKITIFDCSACDCGWCFEFDFSLGAGPFFAAPSAIYASSLGWKPQDGVDGIRRSAEIGINIADGAWSITHIDCEYDYTNGGVWASSGDTAIFMQYSSGVDIGTRLFDGAAPSGVSLHNFNTITVNHGAIQIQFGCVCTHGTPYAGDALIKKIKFRGTGTCPFGTPNC